MAEKEYIERGAALAEIDENFHKTDPCGEEQIGFLKCRRIIREHPAADVVEVVHARWEINCDGYYPYCTNCAYEPPRVPGKDMRTLYCPNCGAKMDGGKTE